MRNSRCLCCRPITPHAATAAWEPGTPDALPRPPIAMLRRPTYAAPAMDGVRRNDINESATTFMSASILFCGQIQISWPSIPV